MNFSASLTAARRRAALSALAVMVAGISTAAAATQPGAGSLGNQLRQSQPSAIPAPRSPDLQLPGDGLSPPPAQPGGTQITVTSVTLSGLDGTGITQQEIAQAVSGFLDQPQTFAGLQAMAATVTALLHERGLPLAQAILPPQTITGGQLEIRVIPGRHDTPQTDNQSPLRDGLASGMVRAAVTPGEVVRREQLERLALLLNEIPGVSSSVEIQQGREPGTSALHVQMRPATRYGGYLALDNQGDATTGRSRAMLGGHINGLLGTGDQLRLDLLAAYEKGGLLNGGLDYSTLITTRGTRAGVSYSRLMYSYRLQGLDFTGHSDNWSLYLQQPWLRSAAARVDVRLDAGQQFLTDKFPAAFGLADTRRHLNTASAGIQGSIASLPGGVSGFTLAGTAGNTLLPATGGEPLLVERPSGAFTRLNYQLTHDQQLNGTVSFHISATGQAAGQNQDSSQKFLTGGPYAVRAYAPGDGAADQGTVVSAELRARWGLPLQWAGHSPQLTLAAFYDQGWSKQFKNNRSASGAPLVTDNNHFTLAGAGIYASLAQAGSYALTLTWAQRTTPADPVSGHDDRHRFWITAVKTF